MLRSTKDLEPNDAEPLGGLLGDWAFPVVSHSAMPMQPNMDHMEATYFKAGPCARSLKL